MPSRCFRVLPAVALLHLVFPIAGWAGERDRDPVFRYEHRQTADPFSIHILEFRPEEFAPEVVRAQDGPLGRETVAAMARRRGAVAAVNGGFFRIGTRYDGEAVGALQIHSAWLSEPYRTRGAIGWTKDGKLTRIDRLRLHSELVSGEKRFPIHGINRSRGRREGVLYTSNFPEHARPGRGVEIYLGADGVVRSSVEEDVAWIYSSGPEGPLQSGQLKPGDRAQVVHRVESLLQPDTAWDQMDFILGGTPVLISGGQVITDFSGERVQETFVTGRHPRTAVCVKEQGDWVLVVVDGRQRRLSLGMTLQELTGLMQELGCRDALNLDGGGSSTFVLSGQIVNRPSDPTGPRPVSDAILLFERPLP